MKQHALREYNEEKRAEKIEKKTAALNRRSEDHHCLLFCIFSQYGRLLQYQSRLKIKHISPSL